MFARKMIKRALLGVSVVAITLSLGASGLHQDAQDAQKQPGQLPAGHPQTGPQLPSDHPQTDDQPVFKAAVEVDRPDANAEDVKSVDAIINAYYASISGPKGQAREWDRMRSLFIAGGRFITARESNGKVSPIIITPEDFVTSNRRYFEGGGYFEQEIHRTVNQFGNVAQVFSTYASRHALSEAKPYSRGINSIQLMKAGGRWWITSILWDYETGQADHQIPLEYLPASIEVKSGETP